MPRFCTRGKVEAGDVEDAGLDPLRVRLRSAGSGCEDQQGQRDVHAGMGVDREDGNRTSSTGNPDSESGPNPASIPAPDSPAASVQLLFPRGPSGRHPG